MSRFQSPDANHDQTQLRGYSLKNQGSAGIQGKEEEEEEEEDRYCPFAFAELLER
jgi:hypothetical protein